MPMVMQSDMSALHAGAILGMSKLTRAAATVFPPERLMMRRNYYIGTDNNGVLANPPPSPPQMPGAGMDPTKMMSQMKFSVVFLILNAGLAYLISYLFSEVIVARTPFNLSPTFKSVVQRGIDVELLDASYVSALSWYFLVLFSSGSYTHLFNAMTKTLVVPGQSALEVMDPMAGGLMAGGGGGPPNPFGGSDHAKQFQAESDSWKLMAATPSFVGIEESALRALS